MRLIFAAKEPTFRGKVILSSIRERSASGSSDFFLPEEPGVRRALPADPLVPRRIAPGSIPRRVGDRQEPVEELPRTVPEGKVLLMCRIAVTRTSARQLQEDRVELPGDHGRPLDEVRDLEAARDRPGLVRPCPAGADMLPGPGRPPGSAAPPIVCARFAGPRENVFRRSVST